MANTYVGLGKKGAKIFLFEKNRTTKFRQVLWGDFLTVDKDMEDGWLRIIWAPDSDDPRNVFIKKAETVELRPLEIVFVDVGQGDGAVLIAPDDDQKEQIIVIDAGERRNMFDFVTDRFKSYETRFDFHAAVITHPDRDHYMGFKPIFTHPEVGFDVVYHSGLVERPVPGKFPKLGGLSDQDPVTKLKYLEALAPNNTVIKAEFADEEKNGNFFFPRVMHAAIKNPKITKFRMLSTDTGKKHGGKTYMPGFSPVEERGYTIEVLGPVVEFDDNGKRRLRKIGDYGETKNGHSVILKLHIGDFHVLFGGDLNKPAEKFLLTHYAGIDKFPKEGSQQYKDMIADASKTFRADVMKVCHHGSEKVTDAFLETVNPACFVISSGDEEGHVHPRPDLLGRLGRFGRGEAPVLLSTELQRSTREREDQKVVDRLKRDVGKLSKNPTEELGKDVAERVARLGRTNVDVWGSIYVKTDGERLITAFKIESGSDTKKWFYFEYMFDDNGQLALVD